MYLVVLDSYNPTCFSCSCNNCPAVKGLDGMHIDDSSRDTLLPKLFCCDKGRVKHRACSDDGHILSIPHQLRFSYLKRGIFRKNSWHPLAIQTQVGRGSSLCCGNGRL